MSDTVFCTECKWFIRNSKPAEDGHEYRLDMDTNARVPQESYWDCSHASNLGKRIEWWGLVRFYKRKPSVINAKNDCVKFENEHQNSKI